MATTDTDVSAGAPRRVLWGAVATATAGVVAAGVLAFGQDAGRPSRATPFWPLITAHGSEIDPPESVDEIAKRSDAIFVGHVTDVVAGRQPSSLDDVTPVQSAPGAPMTRNVFVVLTVDRALSGPLAKGATVQLEMPGPPSPLTPDTLRSRIPSGELLFFLTNGAAVAKRSGFTNPVIQLRERDIWQPASSRALIAAGPTGLYQVLEPDETDTPFLQSFQASTLEEAAARAARAAP